jgi:two-component system sensor histidine kinase/response regulator
MDLNTVESPSGEANAAAARLLIVDDDALSSAFQAHLAALLGYPATTEHDAARAVELALDGRCDVLLLDLGMPGVDGFEALQRLREGERRRGRAPMPVIAVTGYASEADRLRCLMAGFNDHLSKPIQAATLGQALRRVTEARGVPAPAADSTDADRLRAAVQRFSRIKPDDGRFAPTVTESFALRSAQLIEAIRTAAARTDPAEASRAARALKASAEFLGALRLAAMAAALDAAAAAQDWARAGETLRVLDNEHQAVLTLLFESAR